MRKLKLKRLISCVMAVILTAQMIAPVGVIFNLCEEAYADTYGEWEYSEYEDGELCIEGYDGPGGAVVIPEEIDGKKVTSIKGYAFENSSSLTSIEIPSSVTSIGGPVFYGHGLTLTSIVVDEENAVYDSRNNCNAIIEKSNNRLIAGCKSTIIPSDVTSIGASAFNGCSGLTSIEIPGSVEYIEDWAFSHCSGLTSIKIPNSVTNIGEGAFNGCSGLTSIEIPNSVMSIGYAALVGGNNLTIYSEINSYAHTYAIVQNIAWKKVYIDGSEGNLGVWEYSENEDGTLCIDGYNGTESNVVIPEEIDGKLVTSIGEAAFYCCEDLTSIEISSSVTRIEEFAFYGHGINLTDIVVDVNNAIYDSRDNCNAIIEKSSNELVLGCKNTVIPSSVTSIGVGAFAACSDLTSIEIPSSITSIETKAFSECYLVNIEIPSSVAHIGSFAFCGCEALENIEIQGNVESIGEYTFSGCYYLKNIEIPRGVTHIENFAFYECRGLENIKIPDNVTCIGDYAFLECNNLKGIEISNSVTSIGVGAFEGCSSLIGIEIPSSVISIGKGAFERCYDCTIYSISDAYTHTYSIENNIDWKDVSGIWSYSQNEDGTLYIDGYNGPEGTVVIPEEIDGNSVTSIGNSVFEDCSNLLSVEIPNGVTSIGEHTFARCDHLTSIKIPSSVISIGDNAFNGCTSLTNIEIPSSVTSMGNQVFFGCISLENVEILGNITSIGDYAFTGCDSLIGIEIPSSVLSIGDYAFTGCESLIGIEIPNSVISIGDNAFAFCYYLTSIEIPSSVTSIGKSVFYDCGRLDSIVVDTGNEVYDSRDNCNAIIKKTNNELIVGAVKTIIPSSVISIGEHAFAGRAISNIKIPSSVMSIEDNAFSDCNWDLTIYSTNDAYAYTYATQNNIDWKDISANDSEDDIEIFNYSVNEDGTLCIDGYNGPGGDVVIPEEIDGKKVTIIGDSAFQYCESITSIEIPDSVISIADYSFYKCNGLLSIEMSSSLKSIGILAFYKCGLDSIEIPDSVTSIGDSAFVGCSNLEDIEISSGVENIGRSVFSESGISSIVVDENNATYDSRNNCNAIIEKSTNQLIVGCKNTIIPSGVTSIGEGAFEGCSSLTSIEIPNSVTSIGNAAFARCGLTSIEIPNGVTSIGEGAFGWCDLTSIIIPSSVTSIGHSAFAGEITDIIVDEDNTIYDSRNDCNAIIEKSSNKLIAGCKNTIIPSNVTSIGDAAFDWCEKISSIEIPDSITSIGDMAFTGCGLTRLKIPDSVTSIGDEAFSECSSLKSIEIPDSVTSIGVGAFWGCDELTIYSTSDAYAHTYAIDNGINWSEIVSVTFDGNGASGNIPTISIKSGQTIGTLPTPKRTGYSFKGWYSAKSGGTKVATTTKITSNMTLYAQWKINSYNVTFNANGGTTDTTKISVKYSNAIGTLPTPKRTGYSFTGWYTAKTGGTKVATNTKISSNMTLYAQWKINSYNVTFNGNGGKAGYETKKVKYNNAIGSMPSAKRTGYTFKGWYTAKSGGTRVYTTTKIKKSMTVYARWEKKSYKVTFNGNGGKAGYAAKKVKYNTAIGSMPSAKRTGYTFKGWYTAKSGGTRVYTTTKIKKSMTVYARWEKKSYKVTFNGNGGKAGYASKKVKYNTAIGSMPSAKRTGYTFKGWYTAKSGGTRVYTTTKIKKSMTVYARWEKKSYKVTFNGNGGKAGYAYKKVKYNTAIGSMPSASRSGYTFTGWYTAKSGGAKITTTTKITKSMTVYARWTVKRK